MKGHELFPGTDENPNPDVHTILVTRSENGAMMQAPFGYIDQAELPNVGALFARFGGGVYELVARDGKKICSRVRMNVAGDPKPLDGKTAPLVAAPVYAPSGGGGGGGGNTIGTVIAALSALSPVFLGWLQLQGTQAQAQAQMMMAMMNGKSADAAQQTQAMAQLYAAQTQQMGAMFAAMAKGGGGDGSESVVKGMEMMQELMTSLMQGGGGGDGDGENPVNMAEQLLGMLERAKQMASVAPLPPGAAAASPIPAGAPVRDADGETAPEDDEAAAE